jgi:hypothetical protein
MRNIQQTNFSLPLLFLLICAPGRAEQVSTNADGIFESGEWKYQLVLLNQGTSQQMSIGKLSFKGKEVIGGPYHRITTNLGQFMWSPYTCQNSRCGWYKINPKKKYSRWIKANINESEHGPAWHTVEAHSP